MRSKRLTRAAVLAGAIALPLAAAVPAHANHDPSSSAFGIGASGPVAVPLTPSVASTGTKTMSKNVATVPANPLIEARVLHAAAGKGHARASVVDLQIPKAQLEASLVTAKCVKGKGTSHLVKVNVGGRAIKAFATPNTTVAVPLQGLGTVSLTLNKQVRDSHGKLKVTAIEATVPLGPGKEQRISIASATCGAVDEGGPGGPGQPETPPSAPPSAPPGEAPAPTPVPGDLPVTG